MSGISAQRSSTAGANKSLSNLVNVSVNESLVFNPGSDINMDLIKVNVTGTPKLWWDEATNSFEMDKSLSLPGGSLKVGAHVLSEETAEDDDGFAVVGSIHVDKYPGGKAGNLCLHEGTEPIAGAEGDMHRIWVDSNHDIQWQNHLGESSIIHIAGGAHDVPEIYNSLGDLKIQPDVQGDVELFGDTDVGDAVNGKMLYVHRQAVEGDDYIRLYVSASKTGIVSASLGLTVIAPDSVTLQSTGKDIICRMGDDVGAKGTYFKNSSNDIVGSVDSLGNAQFNASVDTSKIGNSGGILKLNPDATGIVELFGDADVGDDENGRMLYVWRRAPEGNEYIRFYISSNQKSFIHTSCPMTLQAQVDFTINSVTEDIIFKVGDNAGVKKFYFQDSDNADVVTIDSDGNAWFRSDVSIGVSSDVLIQANGLSYFNGGNVGIGTSTPGVKLHIESSDNCQVNIWSTGVDTDAILMFGTAESGENFYLTLDESDARKFKMGISSADDMLVIQQNGNVGIGTNSPDYALHLYRTDERSVLHVEANGSNHGEANLFFKTQSDPGWQIFMDDSNLSVLGKADRLGFYHYGSAATRMVIDGSSGNVGIGTTDPKEELHIKSANPTITFEESDAASNEKVWEFGATVEEFLFRTANDLHTGNQTIWRAGARAGTGVAEFTIPNAKMGIGTETLSGRLTVDQSSTSAGIPVLTLDQADVGEPWIEFLGGTISTGKNGQNEYLEVKVGGNTRYLRLFN